jgi:hypothetical protein
MAVKLSLGTPGRVGPMLQRKTENDQQQLQFV